MAKRSRNLDDLAPTPVSEKRLWREREARKPRCCWPRCNAHLRTEVPLCDAHLSIAAQLYSAPRDFVFRYRDDVMRTAPHRKQQAEAAVKSVPHDGVVYYVRVGAYIKIGWTSDLTKRMKAYSPDSVLLATEPGTRKDENRRHKMFAAHRTHGREWYAMVPSLMHHIDQVIAEHGNPDPVAFAAQPVGIPQPREKQYVGGNYRGPGWARQRL